MERVKEHINFNKKRLSEERKEIEQVNLNLGLLQEEKQKIEKELESLSKKQTLEAEIERLELERQTYNLKYFSANVVAGRYLERFKKIIGNEAVSEEELQVIKSEI